MSNVVALDRYRPAVQPERLIIATIQRCSQHMEDRRKVTTRRYLTLNNAMSSVVRWALIDGRVGDIFVIHHGLTGLEIGTVRINAKGKLSAKWAFEE